MVWTRVPSLFLGDFARVRHNHPCLGDVSGNYLKQRQKTNKWISLRRVEPQTSIFSFFISKVLPLGQECYIYRSIKGYIVAYHCVVKNGEGEPLAFSFLTSEYLKLD